MNGRIRRRSKGSWEITIDVGRDAEGNRVRKFVHVKGTKAEAQRKLRELVVSLDMGLSLDNRKESVREFMNRWQREYVSANTRPKTQVSYEYLSRVHILPVLGHLRLQDLTPGDVQRMISTSLEKGISTTTARRVYATLHRALECALRWGAVYRNVADAIDAPKEAHHEIAPPDPATLKTLLTEADNTTYGPAFWLAAYTGLRRGEIAACRWENIDLEKGTLSVIGTVSKENGHLVVTPPKSKTSRRLIHLDDDTIGVLRAHRGRQLLKKIELGELFVDQGYVFTSPTGGILDPDLLTKAWRKLCKKLGLRFRLHDLRHAHASTLIEVGTHIKTVQARLGHSSPSLTMQVYAHVTPGMDKEAADAFAKAISG